MIVAEEPDRNDENALYEEDFAAWLDAQAAALRERRFAELDLDNLIEEVEGVRRAETRSMEHHARVVVAQLLLLAHSTLGDPRWSWKSAAMSHRHQLEMILTPTLRQELEARLEEIHTCDRELAATVLETEGTPQDWLPQKCPYTLAEILDDDCYPTNVYGFDRLES